MNGIKGIINAFYSVHRTESGDWINTQSVPHHGGYLMKKYFVIKTSSYPNLGYFASDIVEILNSNFSNTSEAQEETLKSLGAKSFLTFPEAPMTGSKYIISRATGEAVYKPEADGKFFLGCDGVINPPQARYEGEDNYWNMVNNHNLGHHVLPLTQQVLKETKYFVASSGYSASIISVEIQLDRFRKPQVAICRLTTPFTKGGAYGRHFLNWAEAHGITPKDGKW